MGAVVERFVVGAGGFLGEASLTEIDEDVVRSVARRGFRILELTDVFVHPYRRRRGWGREVVGRAVAHADARGWDLFLRLVPFGKGRGSDGETQRLDCAGLADFYAEFGFVVRRTSRLEMIRRYRAT